MQKHIVERAYELASSGDFSDLADIRQVLSREGYSNVAAHFAGMTFRNELLAKCRQARGLPEKKPGIKQE
jgi:hypothetical protein